VTFNKYTKKNYLWLYFYENKKLLKNGHPKSNTNVGSSIFNQLLDNFDLFPFQNERIILMVGGIVHPKLGRLAHLLYELEIHDRFGGLKEF
jgi:hypothetical protein